MQFVNSANKDGLPPRDGLPPTRWIATAVGQIDEDVRVRPSGENLFATGATIYSCRYTSDELSVAIYDVCIGQVQIFSPQKTKCWGKK